MANGIAINPWDRTVTLVDTEGSVWGLAALKKALAGPNRETSDGIDSVRLESGDCLWVDGDGLLTPDMPIFRLAGYDNPLAGIGLVLGLNAPGDCVSPKLSPEHVRLMIGWTDLATTGDMMGPLPDTTEVRFGQEFTVITPSAGPILKPRDAS